MLCLLCFTDLNTVLLVVLVVGVVFHPQLHLQHVLADGVVVGVHEPNAALGPRFVPLVQGPYDAQVAALLAVLCNNSNSTIAQRTEKTRHAACDAQVVALLAEVCNNNNNSNSTIALSTEKPRHAAYDAQVVALLAEVCKTTTATTP